MSRLLPTRPSLRFLKEQAKDILKAQRKGDVAACSTLCCLRRFAGSSDAEILSAKVNLQEVQFALALEYGFTSWDHLTRVVAIRGHIIKHIDYWERFGPAEGFDSSTEGKTQGILTDPEWIRLVEMEMSLGRPSGPCAKIRRQIACLERCHESYIRNVESIFSMIDAMVPGPIIDCGWACNERRAEAAAYAQALEAWVSDGTVSPEDDRHLHQVRELLGDVTARKAKLVRHLIAKLLDNSHNVLRDNEDFATVEAHIEHLAICNFNWQKNLLIVLREIAAGKQLVPWHTSEGFNAHGDCPDRSSILYPLVEEVLGWISGRSQNVGRWVQVLRKGTPEKHWLAACLCKTIVVHHGRVGAKVPPKLRLS